MIVMQTRVTRWGKRPLVTANQKPSIISTRQSVRSWSNLQSDNIIKSNTVSSLWPKTTVMEALCMNQKFKNSQPMDMALIISFFLDNDNGHHQLVLSNHPTTDYKKKKKKVVTSITCLEDAGCVWLQSSISGECSCEVANMGM